MKMLLTSEPIKHFKGDYFFLSNMYPIEPFSIGKYTFKSTENFYMAMKFMDSQIRYDISLKSPREAKKWSSNKVKSDPRNLRSDWHDIKLEVMEYALRHKFNQTKCRNLLLKTGNVELIEGNTWNDTFWGVDLKDPEEPGQNQLGRLLMMLRSKIQANPTIDLLNDLKFNSRKPNHGKIIVVNRRKETEDIYVGRSSGLGNPYAVHNGDFSLDDSMRLYSEHFYKHILHDSSSKGYPIARKIMLWIKNGHDVKLGCYCKKFCSDDIKYEQDTALCHADTIKSYLEREIQINP